MNYTQLIFRVLLAASGILVFAVWSNAYAQQPYSSSPPTYTAPSIASSTPKQTNNTAATNAPIVLKPLAGGTCPTGYHLVSGAVCIKDITPSPSSSRPPSTRTTTTPIIPTTNASQSLSNRPASASQPNTNPTNLTNNNDENFNTKILKSFNNEFK